MLDVASIGRAAAALGLNLAPCRLDIEAGDRVASPGAERAISREILEQVAETVADPSGWLWGDTGLVRIAEQTDLLRYEGILFSAEIGSEAVSVHVRALADATWRVATYREVSAETPTHLVEPVTLLGASLRNLPDLADARAAYRRYWQVASNDRSRPVATRLLELR